MALEYFRQQVAIVICLLYIMFSPQNNFVPNTHKAMETITNPEVTLEDRVDAMIEVVRNMAKFVGYKHETEQAEGGLFLSVEYVQQRGENYFKAVISIAGLSDIPAFSSLQMKANFPPGVNFTKATKGIILADFGFGYQAKDGHSKEGLIGAYTSSNNGAVEIEGDTLLLVAYFEGPLDASSFITFDECYFGAEVTVTGDENFSFRDPTK